MYDEKKSCFKIIGAHTDSPSLRIAPNSYNPSGELERYNIQTYGGGLWHTWFDRDLSVAGKVVFKNSEGKLDSKINGSTIYDHVKELNDSSNYYYCRYPFVNNISSYDGLSTNIRPGTDGYTFDDHLYPVDGYYGHETAGQEYGKSHERMYNYIYDINVSNKIGTIYRQRNTNNNTADYPNYNNYFGYTYKDCQKYTISSTDLVNVRDESGQDTSSITGGRTLWKNINTESQLIANISFLNSSSYNQHIGLYVSKDTTNNDYGIDIEEEVSIPEIEIPPTTSEVEKSEDINGNTLPPINITYTQGINWAMPPKFQDYFSESNKIDIYKLFTGDELRWENNERYLDNSFFDLFVQLN